MSLNIGSATSGVDQEGMVTLINRINVDAIEPTKQDIRTKAEQVREAVDSAWEGKSAEAFKNKVDRDTETLCNALDAVGHGIEENLNTAASNVEDYDAEIANKLDNE